MSLTSENISAALFEFLRSRIKSIDTLNDKGEPTVDNEEAKVFGFEFAHNNKVLGNITVTLLDDDHSNKSLKVYYGKDLANLVDRNERKDFQNFLHDLRIFAKSKMLGFDVRDINKQMLSKRDLAPLVNIQKKREENSVAESKFSKLSGTVKTSVQTLENAKLVIKHSDKVNEEVPGARSRHIHKIFIINKNDERFMMPFTNLGCGRAMAQHVNQGGNPYDNYGVEISNLANETKELGKFLRRTKGKSYVSEEANELIESAAKRYTEARSLIKRLQSTRGYKTCKEELLKSDDLPEALTNETFITQHYDQQLESAMPYVWRAHKMNKMVKEMSELESWADNTTAQFEDAPLNELNQGNASDIGSIGDLVKDPQTGKLTVSLKKQDPNQMVQAVKKAVGTQVDVKLDRNLSMSADEPMEGTPISGDYNKDAVVKAATNFSPQTQAGQEVKKYLDSSEGLPNSYDDLIGLIDEVFYEMLEGDSEGAVLPEERKDLTAFYSMAKKSKNIGEAAEGKSKDSLEQRLENIRTTIKYLKGIIEKNPDALNASGKPYSTDLDRWTKDYDKFSKVAESLLGAKEGRKPKVAKNKVDNDDDDDFDVDTRRIIDVGTDDDFDNNDDLDDIRYLSGLDRYDESATKEPTNAAAFKKAIKAAEAKKDFQKAKALCNKFDKLFPKEYNEFCELDESIVLKKKLSEGLVKNTDKNLTKFARLLKFPAASKINPRGTEVRWYKRGGYAGRNAIEKSIKAARENGFKEYSDNDSNSPDGSVFVYSTTFVNKEGYQFSYNRRVGVTKDDNDYSMTLKPPVKAVSESASPDQNFPKTALDKWTLDETGELKTLVNLGGSIPKELNHGDIVQFRKRSPYSRPGYFRVDIEDAVGATARRPWIGRVSDNSGWYVYADELEVVLPSSEFNTDILQSDDDVEDMLNGEMFDELDEADDLQKKAKPINKTTTTTKVDPKIDVNLNRDEFYPDASRQNKAQTGQINLNKTSQDRTASAMRNVKLDDKSMVYLLMLALNLPEDEFDDELGVIDFTEPKPNLLPKVISSAMLAAGTVSPEFHAVKHLPGYMSAAIRQIGRAVFAPFTSTPIADIQVIANINGGGPNTDQELNAVASFLQKNGTRQHNLEDDLKIEFKEIMPGYSARIVIRTFANYTFMLVVDHAGKYVYAWPSTDTKAEITDKSVQIALGHNGGLDETADAADRHQSWKERMIAKAKSEEPRELSLEPNLNPDGTLRPIKIPHDQYSPERRRR